MLDVNQIGLGEDLALIFGINSAAEFRILFFSWPQGESTFEM